MERDYVPEGVKRRHRKSICSYRDNEMNKECDECGAQLVRFRTRYARAPNYHACMNCKEVVKIERATG